MGTVTRRAAMKTALKGAGYAAPVVLAATVPAAVSAQVSGIPRADFIAATSITGLTTVHNGGTITFVSTVTNGGPNASAMLATDLLAAGTSTTFTIVSATTTLGTFTPPIGGVYGSPLGNISGTWTIPTLAAGQTATLTVTVRQAGQTVTTPTLYAINGSPRGGAIDPNPGNNFASVSFTSAP